MRPASPASEYVDLWLRLRRPLENHDDPGDAARWDRRKELEEEMRRTGVDPVARQLREQATGATGGNPNPGRDPER